MLLNKKKRKPYVFYSMLYFTFFSSGMSINKQIIISLINPQRKQLLKMRAFVVMPPTLAYYFPSNFIHTNTFFSCFFMLSRLIKSFQQGLQTPSHAAKNIKATKLWNVLKRFKTERYELNMLSKQAKHTFSQTLKVEIPKKKTQNKNKVKHVSEQNARNSLTVEQRQP